MNTTTIEMPVEQAKEKLKSLRRKAHKDAEEFYAGCTEAYEALEKGTPLISLTQAIREGGFDNQMRPNLAVARADRKQVRFDWSSGRKIADFNSNLSIYGHQYPTLIQSIDMGRVHGWVHEDGWRKQIRAYARVPEVPADVRPKTGQLKEWFILWEVDDWSEEPFLADPPRDPYLLKQIGDTDLYAVLAEWDLTEVERAVMKNQLIG